MASRKEEREQRRLEWREAEHDNIVVGDGKPDSFPTKPPANFHGL